MSLEPHERYKKIHTVSKLLMWALKKRKTCETAGCVEHFYQNAVAKNTSKKICVIFVHISQHNFLVCFF